MGLRPNKSTTCTYLRRLFSLRLERYATCLVSEASLPGDDHGCGGNSIRTAGGARARLVATTVRTNYPDQQFVRANMHALGFCTFYIATMIWIRGWMHSWLASSKTVSPELMVLFCWATSLVTR
jgi:hypothetical protein